MYLGIIVEQSLTDKSVLKLFEQVAIRQGRAWTYYLVSAEQQSFAPKLSKLMAAMDREDYWYTHFFKGKELIVVYRDAIYYVSTDSITWGAAVARGQKNGIPTEQLDFCPRDKEGVKDFFALTEFEF